MKFFLILAAFVVAPFAPRLGDPLLSRIEEFGTRLARRKALSVFLVVLTTIVLRVSLLPVMPVPYPGFHDEFSYLLAGDTFAHGRLANPPHPMWTYFDTFHVNGYPAYVSIFPPAQGAVLALGELMGHPWIGVLLSCAAMSGAIVWMLQGWLPPRWALLGGMLALLHIGISSYWMNSYWGGAVAATGGALAVGALPRIMRKGETRDAVILGIGTAILANSRPFEGLIFSIPVYVAIAVWLFRGRSVSPAVKVQRIVAPLALILLLCAAFMLHYNARTTGSPVHFAHVDNIRTHLSIPQLAWEKDRPPFHFSNPQFEALYNVWWPRDAWQTGRPDSVKHIALTLVRDAVVVIGFYLLPELCVGLIGLPRILSDRRVKFLSIQWAISFAGLTLVAVCQPHYVAPLTATTFALVTQGLRHLRQWKVEGRAVGIALTRAVVLCAVAFAPFHTFYDWRPSLADRARVEARLDAMPGDQLVVVRYSPKHDPFNEWVYNSATIDNAHIVWAREIPGLPMKPLLDYFRGRRVWLVEPDSLGAELLAYSPDREESTPMSSVTKAENAEGQSVHGW